MRLFFIEQNLEDILSPLRSITERLKGYIDSKYVLIDMHKATIKDSQSEIARHESDKQKAQAALANVSALFGANQNLKPNTGDRA